MKTRFSNNLAAMLGLACISYGSISSLSAEEAESKKPNWNIIQVDGIDYVSGLDIASFYSFEYSGTEEGVAEFRYRTMELILDSRDQKIRVNELEIEPCLPLKTNETGQVLVSTTDLAYTLDPTIRPTYVKADSGFLRNITVQTTGSEQLAEWIQEGQGDRPESTVSTPPTVFVEVEKGGEIPTVSAQILPPVRFTDKKSEEEKAAAKSANRSRSISMAMAAAYVASIQHSLIEVRSEGVLRGEHPTIAEAEGPAIRLLLQVPEDFDDWREVAQSMMEAEVRLQRVGARREN